MASEEKLSCPFLQSFPLHLSRILTYRDPTSRALLVFVEEAPLTRTHFPQASFTLSKSFSFNETKRDNHFLSRVDGEYGQAVSLSLSEPSYGVADPVRVLADTIAIIMSATNKTLFTVKEIILATFSNVGPRSSLECWKLAWIADGNCHTIRTILFRYAAIKL